MGASASWSGSAIPCCEGLATLDPKSGGAGQAVRTDVLEWGSCGTVAERPMALGDREDPDSEGDQVNAVPERARDVTCPQCKRPFELVWNGALETPETLVIRSCPSGGVYDVRIECPHCDYEEPL